MHETKVFKADDLIDAGLPFDDGDKYKVISDNITGQSRWSVIHTLIFRESSQSQGDAWRTTYSQGATENQDEQPWEHTKEVKATLVRLVEVVTPTWLPVDAPSTAP